MKKFSFRLDKILELRKFNEKEAEMELSKRNSIKNALEIELASIAKQRVMYSQKRKKNESLENLIVLENYINRLDNEKEVLFSKLVLVEIEVQEAREVYMQALKRRKVITKLKEKKLQEWKKNNMLEQEISLDDIINSKENKKLKNNFTH